MLGGRDGRLHGEPGAAVAPQAPNQTAPSESAPAQQPSTGGDGAGAYVTPLVRRLAAERGVDLGSVSGTGVGGRIRKQDVLTAAESAQQPAEQPAPSGGAAAAKPAAPAPDTSVRGRTEKMSRLRAVIAKRMVESLAISAQLTTVVEPDVTPIARLRDQPKADFAAREGVKLSFLPFFAKAAVDALKAHLAPREILLVFDNFEHILDTAPLLNDLLTAAERLTILATSRESLFIYGERTYTVPPLNLPEPGDDLSRLPGALALARRARSLVRICSSAVANSATEVARSRARLPP